MFDTGQYEAYELCVTTPLAELIGDTGGSIIKFIRKLRLLTGNIRGEARRNLNELLSGGLDQNRFFGDLLGKVKRLEESIFVVSPERVLYQPDKTTVVEVNRYGNEEEAYAFFLFDTLQEINTYFSSYLTQPQNETQPVTPSCFNVVYDDREVLNDAYNQLVRFNYIAARTDKRDFINIFTGRAPRQPVIWIGGYNTLAYLIRGLIENKVLTPMRRNAHWPIVMNAFTTNDGPIQNINKLRNSDPPEDTTNLEVIIQTFSSPLG